MNQDLVGRKAAGWFFSLVLFAILTGFLFSALPSWADPPPGIDHKDEPAPHGGRPNLGSDSGTPDASRSPHGALGLSPHPSGQAPDAFQPGGSAPKDKAGKAADSYLEQKGLDPSSSAGSVIKPVVGTTIADNQEGAFRFQYDIRDNRIDVVDPAGNTTQFNYDATGRLIQITNPDGSTSRTHYDAAGRVIEVINPDGSMHTDGASIPGPIQIDTQPPVISELSTRPEPFTPNSDLNPGVDDTTVINPEPPDDLFPSGGASAELGGFSGGFSGDFGGSVGGSGNAGGTQVGGNVSTGSEGTSASGSASNDSGSISLGGGGLGGSHPPGPEPRGGSPGSSAGGTLPGGTTVGGSANVGGTQVGGGLGVNPDGSTSVSGSADSGSSSASVSGGSAPSGEAGNAGGEGADGDGSGGGKGDQKAAEEYQDAIDQGMEILYGGMRPLPAGSDSQPGGTDLPPIPGPVGPLGPVPGTQAGSSPLDEAVQQLQNPPSTEQLQDAIDQGMETLYGGMRVLPATGSDQGPVNVPSQVGWPMPYDVPLHGAGADGGEGADEGDGKTSTVLGEPVDLHLWTYEDANGSGKLDELEESGAAEEDGGGEPPEGAGADADKGYVTHRQERELRDLANRPGATQEDVRNWAMVRAQLTGQDPNAILQEYYRDHAYENSRAVDADYAQRIAAAERAGNQDLANQLRQERTDFRTRFDQAIRMGGSSVDRAAQWVSAERARLMSPENAAPQPPPSRSGSLTSGDQVTIIGLPVNPVGDVTAFATFGGDFQVFPPSGPQYVLDEGGGRRRTFEYPNNERFLQRTPPPPAEGQGGAGDAGDEGADEGGETQPGGSEGGAGDAGGEGTDGGGGDIPPAPVGPEFPDGSVSSSNDIWIDTAASTGEFSLGEEGQGGAGDAGGEGADEGEGGSVPPPIEIDFSGAPLTFPRTPTGREAPGTYSPPVDWKTVGDESGAAGDAGGEGADEGGGPPPDSIQIVDTTPPPPGVSESLNIMTLWVKRGIRGAGADGGEGGAGDAGGEGADGDQEPPGGAGDAGGEGTEEGGGEGTGGPPSGTRTLADVLKEGPPEGVPDEAKYDSGDWVYTDENGVQHRYNGQGMLMSQVVPGQDGAGSTVIHYGPGSVSIQQNTADGWSVTTHYEVRDGQLVPKSSMMTRSPETYRYTYDENGNITGIERLVGGLWRGQWDKEGNPTDGDGNPITPNVYNRLPDGRGEPPDPFQNNPQLRDLISKEIERAKTDPKSTNLAPLTPEPSKPPTTGLSPLGPFTVEPAGVQFNPPAPITIPNFSRDLQTDLFFGSGLESLLPPTAGEAGGTEMGFGAPNGQVAGPSLDPQLDTGSALLDGASSVALLGAAGAGGGGPAAPDPALVALHNNFHGNQQAGLAAFQANQTVAHTASHAQQAADLANFQGGQTTFHDGFHTQQDLAHTNFHNLFPGGPGFGAQHGQFHAQEGQAHGDLHAQQATDLNAFQGGQQADENALHTNQQAALTAFQGGQDGAHTNFHNANPGV